MLLCSVVLIPGIIIHFAMKIREKRKDEKRMALYNPGIGHKCQECEDYEARIHKGYCYYREMPCKAWDNACPFFKKRNGAA